MWWIYEYHAQTCIIPIWCRKWWMLYVWMAWHANVKFHKAKKILCYRTATAPNCKYNSKVVYDMDFGNKNLPKTITAYGIQVKRRKSSTIVKYFGLPLATGTVLYTCIHTLVYIARYVLYVCLLMAFGWSLCSLRKSPPFNGNIFRCKIIYTYIWRKQPTKNTKWFELNPMLGFVPEMYTNQYSELPNKYVCIYIHTNTCRHTEKWAERSGFWNGLFMYTHSMKYTI